MENIKKKSKDTSHLLKENRHKPTIMEKNWLRSLLIRERKKYCIGESAYRHADALIKKLQL